MLEKTKSQLTKRSEQLDDRRHPQAMSRKPRAAKSRMPSKSVFYEKVIPVLLIGMGILTILLILFALGVLLGVIESV